MIAPTNLYVAWLAMLIGLISGTAMGLFFHREDWLGGYAAWRRRMLRLGHISLFGTGLLNLAFALTVEHLNLTRPLPIASTSLLVGAIAMPSVCFLSAWRIWFRHLFFIPVVSLLLGTVDLLFRGLFR